MQLRSMRLANSIADGSLTGAELETLLADPRYYADITSITQSRTTMRKLTRIQAAMDSIAASSTAMDAVVSSSVARDDVIASSVAMNAVALSSVAMNIIAESSVAMNAVALSSVAMDSIAESSTAMNAVATWSTSMDAVVANPTSLSYFLSSPHIDTIWSDGNNQFASTFAAYIQTLYPTKDAYYAVFQIPIDGSVVESVSVWARVNSTSSSYNRKRMYLRDSGNLVFNTSGSLTWTNHNGNIESTDTLLEWQQTVGTATSFVVNTGSDVPSGQTGACIQASYNGTESPGQLYGLKFTRRV